LQFIGFFDIFVTLCAFWKECKFLICALIMNYEILTHLSQNHPSLKILRAHQMPLIMSFLHKTFKSKNRISIDQEELENKLTNELYKLKERGEEDWQNKASELLQQWSDAGYLRRYYPSKAEIPVYELTPATEKNLSWLETIVHQEHFVGAESRFKIILEVLKDILLNTTNDPIKQIQDLRTQQEEIEKKIQRIVNQGAQKYTNTQIKERIDQLTYFISMLLSDFRQIEYNFRELDKNVRDKIITDELAKRELL